MRGGWRGKGSGKAPTPITAARPGVCGDRIPRFGSSTADRNEGESPALHQRTLPGLLHLKCETWAVSTCGQNVLFGSWDNDTAPRAAVTEAPNPSNTHRGVGGGGAGPEKASDLGSQK